MLPHEKEHERQAFKEMPFGKKVEHFLTYYLLQTCIIAAVVVTAGIFIYNAFIKKRDTIVLSTVVYDDIFEADALDALTGKLREMYALTDEHEVVRIDNSYRSRSTDDRMRMTVLVSAGECDVIVADEPFFTELAGYGYFADLESVLPEADKEKLGKYFVNAKGQGNTESYSLEVVGGGEGDEAAFGLDLSDSEVWKSLGGNTERPVAGIFSGTQRAENAVRFMEYLYGGS